MTGASGLLGGALLRTYRGRSGRLFALRHQRPLPRGVSCTAVAGDLTVPLFGLSPGDYRDLAAVVTRIIHCAAITDFNRPLSESRRVNVEGTRNVLRFARDCRRLERVAVLSTAYVAGRRTGRISEDDLAHRRGFVNTYERSKYEMERLVRSAMPTTPIAVYRLSTIVGHARTGRVAQFNALHRALRLYSRGLIPMIPGHPDSPVDVISSDYAEAAVCHLFEHAFEAGTTYHLVAGESSSIRLADLLAIVEHVFTRAGGEWVRRAVSAAPIVPLATFRLLEKATTQTENPFLAGILTSMNAFAPQLCYPKTFDATVARVALGPAGIGPSSAAELIDRVVRYCVRSNWGARPR